MTIIKKLVIAAALGIGTAALSGCGPAHVQVGAVVTPRLVWVAPGIWVVEDHPYAVYYADGFYWRYANGIWFRSAFYDGGFARVHIGIVPRIVIGAYRPMHIRYRAPVHVRARPIVRDHRAPYRRR